MQLGVPCLLGRPVRFSDRRPVHHARNHRQRAARAVALPAATKSSTAQVTSSASGCLAPSFECAIAHGRVAWVLAAQRPAASGHKPVFSPSVQLRSHACGGGANRGLVASRRRRCSAVRQAHRPIRLQLQQPSAAALVAVPSTSKSSAASPATSVPASTGLTTAASSDPTVQSSAAALSASSKVSVLREGRILQPSGLLH